MAEQALLDNGLVFDENVQLYFDKTNNLHYDSVSSDCDRFNLIEIYLLLLK